MVAHFVRDEGAAGSNPVIPILNSHPNGSHREAFDPVSGKMAFEALFENPQPSKHKIRQTRTQTPTFLSVKDAAIILGKNERTIARWCASGTLAAIPKAFGIKTTWLISPQAVELKLLEIQHSQSASVDVSKVAKRSHKDLIGPWKAAMRSGGIGNKPFSPRTIETYNVYLPPFVQKYKTVSAETLKKALNAIPVEQFAKRLKLYEAVVCFAKFAVQENSLEASELEAIKQLRPKRHLPPKRNTVTERQLGSLTAACKDPLDTLIVTLLANTGLRAFEACNLRLSDIDLAAATLNVQLGKNNKPRTVGLNPATIQTIQQYVEVVKPSTYLLLNSKGQKMDRHGLKRRLERIGRDAGVKVSPHSLRRVFVTLNANRGKPLPMIQMACGHSDIRTTMGYCQTSQDELIESMKQWD